MEGYNYSDKLRSIFLKKKANAFQNKLRGSLPPFFWSLERIFMVMEVIVIKVDSRFFVFHITHASPEDEFMLAAALYEASLSFFGRSQGLEHQLKASELK